MQRAFDAVVLRRPALLVLRLLEVGQDGGEVPPLVAGIMPAVVVVGMASDIDHRVDGAGSPERLATRPVKPAAAQMRLLLGFIGPVAVGLKKPGERGRNAHLGALVRPSGLQQQDRHRRVFAEPAGQDAPGRAGADQDVVVHENAHGGIVA